jgi:hypothetical protein
MAITAPATRRVVSAWRRTAISLPPEAIASIGSAAPSA